MSRVQPGPGGTGSPDREAPRSEGIPLGRISGVPVILAWSWFAIAAFIVLVFTPQVQSLIPGIGAMAYLVSFSYAVLLLLSVLVHELAHALSARAFGWPTARIVLNVWGGHTQFDNFQASAGRSLVVALAGPAANFVLAGAGWAVKPLFSGSPVGWLLTDSFVVVNLAVAIFNVLPGLPLDGGRLVESAVWKATGSQEKGTVAAGWARRIIVILLVFGSAVLPVLMGRRPDLTFVLMIVLVGGFLWTGASAAITHARLRLRLPEVTAGGLQVRAIALPADATVAQVAAARLDSPGTEVILTAATGQPEAVVDLQALQAVPAAAAASTPAAAVARALAPGAYVPEWAAGQELVQYLARVAGNEYAVIDGQSRVTGLLLQDSVVRALTGKVPGRR
ncbi:site-2 protease family protein [Arthrobacter deserti]|uniref:Zinc metalloprotease n=1 Tax=Arthrobacter deserti TaxID=1742687 RepID=A0ABX1JJ71_9MICC|nr:site-2 protease family protein [Arthrobacter deserti]